MLGIGILLIKSSHRAHSCEKSRLCLLYVRALQSLAIGSAVERKLLMMSPAPDFWSWCPSDGLETRTVSAEPAEEQSCPRNGCAPPHRVSPPCSLILYLLN